MSFPCPTKIDCPGSDDPIMNLSAEGYDLRRFLQIAYPPNSWRGQCCQQFCDSTVSQQDADLCAYNLAVTAGTGACLPVTQPDGSVQCVSPDGFGCATCDPPIPPIFWNAEQCCSVNCPNGSVFTACIAAHSVSATSQIEADRIASSLACQQAALKRFCFDPIIFPCCSGKAYAQAITITGGTAPFSWSVISGSLPSGLTLAAVSPDFRTMEIVGTPTSSGHTAIGVLVVDAAGNTLTATLNIYALAILPSTLPDAELGVAYSQQLSVSPAAPGVSAFTLVSGALPTGLTITSAGLISGTPTGGLPASFTIGVTVT